MYIVWYALFGLFVFLGGISPDHGQCFDNLSVSYGAPILPSHIKYYEVDDHDAVMLNPYLQVGSLRHKAVLDPAIPAYDWVIDTQGDVRIIRTVSHPRGRTYADTFVRPEDGYRRVHGYIERYGHVSALGGGPGRIGGEIVRDEENSAWIINNKSGRYSKSNPDRTPEVLSRAAVRIHAVVDPGGYGWGPVVYLIDYGPVPVRTMEKQGCSIFYAFPARARVPYVILPDIDE